MEALQEKANIVSAFAIIFGLEIASEKLRAFAVDYGNEHSPGPHKELEVQKAGGGIDLVPMATSGVLKHLGVLHSLDGSYKEQVEKTALMIRKYTAIISSRRTTADVKLLVLSISVMAKALYPMKFATLSLAEYRALDKEFNIAFKKLSRFMPSHPNALLYISKVLGGSGFPQFSSRCQLEKLAWLHRSAYSDHKTKVAGQALILHQAYQAAIVPAPQQFIEIPHIPPLKGRLRGSDTPLVLDSLLEYLNELGLDFAVGGVPMLESPQESVVGRARRQGVVISPADRQLLNVYGIQSMGDIARLDGGAPRYIEDRLIGLGMRLESLGEPPEGAQSLRAGQIWRYQDCSE